MNLKSWHGTVGHERKLPILIALLAAFGGVALLIDRPKGTVLEWIAPALLVGGSVVFTWAVWPQSAPPSETSNSLASRLLRRITLDHLLVPFFPAIGVAVLLADLIYNLTLSATPSLQTEDTIVILAAATLLGYNLVPKRFARERDFVLLFFLSLNVILVMPLLLTRAYYADFEKSVDVYSWVALAPQTSTVLHLLGVSNTVHPVSGATAPGLTFTPQHMSVQVTVVITTSCSGIYSVGIFAAAFLAFVLTEYEKMTREVWALLGLGLLAAYMANVLRMVIIVLVGYYTDSPQTDLQNMLVAHSYAGWAIFLGWIALFWGVVLNFLYRPSAKDETRAIGTRKSEAERHGVRCGICEKPMTPAIPGTRCSCGRFFHVHCSETFMRCPLCQRPMNEPESGESISASL